MSRRDEVSQWNIDCWLSLLVNRTVCPPGVSYNQGKKRNYFVSLTVSFESFNISLLYEITIDVGGFLLFSSLKKFSCKRFTLPSTSVILQRLKGELKAISFFFFVVVFCEVTMLRSPSSTPGGGRKKKGKCPTFHNVLRTSGRSFWSRPTFRSGTGEENVHHKGRSLGSQIEMSVGWVPGRDPWSTINTDFPAPPQTVSTCSKVSRDGEGSVYCLGVPRTEYQGTRS